MDFRELRDKYNRGEDIRDDEVMNAIEGLNIKIVFNPKNIDWWRVIGDITDLLNNISHTPEAKIKEEVFEYLKDGIDWEYDVLDLVEVSIDD